jgi:hypothetical protein
VIVLELWLMLLSGATVTVVGLCMILLPLIRELNAPKPAEVDPDDLAVKLLGADGAAEYRRQARRRTAIQRARARGTTRSRESWPGC